jgi:hypothetical protein
VSGLVIFFPVVRGGSTVCDCGEFVVFGGFLVRVVWHSVSNPFSPLQLRILQFSKLFNYEHSPRAGLCGGECPYGIRVEFVFVSWYNKNHEARSIPPLSSSVP